MSYQEQTNKQIVNDDRTYVGVLPNGDFYVGTEPPVGGFATDAGAIMEEPPLDGFAPDAEAGMEEQQNPLSMLPQNRSECFGHQMWDLSKTCAVCGKCELAGTVRSNPELLTSLTATSFEPVPNIMMRYPLILRNQSSMNQLITQAVFIMRYGGVVDVAIIFLRFLTAQIHFVIRDVMETGWTAILDKLK